MFVDERNLHVDWMGKCTDDSPTCEWEACRYNTTHSENRCNRISAYVFDPTAGLGSAALMTGKAPTGECAATCSF